MKEKPECLSDKEADTPAAASAILSMCREESQAMKRGKARLS